MQKLLKKGEVNQRMLAKAEVRFYYDCLRWERANGNDVKRMREYELRLQRAIEILRLACKGGLDIDSPLYLQVLPSIYTYYDNKAQALLDKGLIESY